MTGSPKDQMGRVMLKVIHCIEYLWYNRKEKRVEVWGDFFVANTSKEWASIRALHRGNVKFRLAGVDWLTDTRWTQILKMIAAKYMGLQVMANGEIFLSRVGAEPLKITLLKEDGALKGWSPAPPSADAFTCFTGWESPLIEPGTCTLFRVKGTISGETYERLLGQSSTRQGEQIQIMGGKPLEETIRRDTEKVQDGGATQESFEEFLSKYLDRPSFYHIFFEFDERRKAKCIEISGDMRETEFNVHLKEENRCVSWCCSDMDFNIFAKANGPLLVVSPEPATV